jgi:hypothetical protein
LQDLYPEHIYAAGEGFSFTSGAQITRGNYIVLSERPNAFTTGRKSLEMSKRKPGPDLTLESNLADR